MSPLASRTAESFLPWRPSSTPRRLGRRSGTRGAEHEWSLRRTRLESPVRLVRFSVQELALISDYWLHILPFFELKSVVLILVPRPSMLMSCPPPNTEDENEPDSKKLADGVGIAPTRAEAPLGFQDRGITALPTIQSDLRLQTDDLRINSTYRLASKKSSIVNLKS